VLRVKLRGLDRLGKAFVTAADHEWGGKMHDAADRPPSMGGLARQSPRPESASSVYGARYGGYAALTAATKKTETFACNRGKR